MLLGPAGGPQEPRVTFKWWPCVSGEDAFPPGNGPTNHLALAEVPVGLSPLLPTTGAIVPHSRPHPPTFHGPTQHRPCSLLPWAAATVHSCSPSLDLSPLRSTPARQAGPLRNADMALLFPSPDPPLQALPSNHV